MGWHSDDEYDMGSIIASVSLGAARTFQFRRKMPPEDIVSMRLTSGSLLVMSRPLPAIVDAPDSQRDGNRGTHQPDVSDGHDQIGSEKAIAYARFTAETVTLLQEHSCCARQVRWHRGTVRASRRGSGAMTGTARCAPTEHDGNSLALVWHASGLPVGATIRRHE